MPDGLSATNMLMTPPCMCCPGPPEHQPCFAWPPAASSVSKSRGFLFQVRPLCFSFSCCPLSISFITGQHTMKHLGLFLVYNMQAASHQQFTGIYHAISAKVRPLGSSGPVISRQGSCGQAGPSCLTVVSFCFLNREIVHLPSDDDCNPKRKKRKKRNDEGTERTWLEPEQRPRKRVPKRSVHIKAIPARGLRGLCMCRRRSKPCRQR